MTFYKKTKIVCYTIPFFNALAVHTECHLSHCLKGNLMCHIN